MATRKIKSGESFQFNATAVGMSLTFSGAVPAESVTMTAPAEGFNYWGNPFPADVDIQTILPSAQGGNIQFLNAAQGCSEYYYWYKASNGEAGPKGKKVKTDKEGLWFQRIYNWSTGKVSEEFVATRQVKAGEGFQFSCSAGVSLTIPKPYSL